VLNQAANHTQQRCKQLKTVFDPINKYAVKFYKKFGFEQLPDSAKKGYFE